MDRNELKLAFLKKRNLDKEQRINLKQDASHRRYERILKTNGEQLILMDAIPAKEDVRPFIYVANLLREHNFSAPEIIDEDIDNGFLLLEDFGDESFTKILSGKSALSQELEEELMYKKAIDNLINLHKIPINNSALNLINYDEPIFTKESLRFVDYYLNVLNGDQVTKAQRDEFIIILKHLLSLAKNFSNVVVLRDYHADNLMWLHDRKGHNKVGLLDFQDAVIGSPIYDLVSLLEDARRDVPIAIVEKMLMHYLQHLSYLPQKEFAATYAILGIQRNLKIVGTFARLATMYKNPYYLTLLPRVWRHINNNLKHPLLLPLKKWLQRAVPLQVK